MQILSEPFTSLADYLTWVEPRPDEEHYEVVDGQPVMSPSPAVRHQVALAHIWRLLRDSCPSNHMVLPAPLDWVLWEAPRLQIREPDLVVVARDQIDRPRLTQAPLLAGEVLSPSSFERDAVTKRQDYARAGLDHYWIVDPETPQIAVYRRAGDRLELVAHPIGHDEVVVDEPVSVRLRPSELLL